MLASEGLSSSQVNIGGKFQKGRGNSLRGTRFSVHACAKHVAMASSLVLYLFLFIVNSEF